MRNKFIRSLAAVLAVAAATLFMTPMAAQANTTTHNLDCTADQATVRNFVVEGSDTITMHFTNCGLGEEYDVNYGTLVDEFSVTGDLVMVAGDNFGFANGTGGFLAYVNVMYASDENVPSGTLLFTEDMTIGTVPDEFDVGPVNGDFDQHFLADNETCGLSADGARMHIYTTMTFEVTEAGEYTFRGIGSTPLSQFHGGAYHPLGDSFLALYEGFDPANPDDNVVTCNDDLNDLFGYDNNEVVEGLPDGVLMEGHMPYLVADLQPGTYTLLLSVWDPIGSEDWQAGQVFVWEFANSAASTRVQAWGPANGATLVEEVGEEGSLAATGSGQELGWTAFAALLMFAGAITLLRTKKN
jgi:hypothetical protein